MSRTGRILRKLKSLKPVMLGHARVSYSQHGEDIIVFNFLNWYGVKDVRYLDIGANDPVRDNNTYLLYNLGHRGVLIEPNPTLAQHIKKVRPADTCLNLGIGIEPGTHEADYYMFAESHGALNTFSKEDADRYKQEGYTLQKMMKMPLQGINEIVQKHLGSAPTYMSLDVEGLDEAILRTYDFDRYAPLLLCVETAVFSRVGEMEKRKDLIDLVTSKGYFVYADTNANTLFCHRAQFDKILSSR
jgi:FkbM family methyltransferase